MERKGGREMEGKRRGRVRERKRRGRGEPYSPHSLLGLP